SAARAYPDTWPLRYARLASAACRFTWAMRERTIVSRTSGATLGRLRATFAVSAFSRSSVFLASITRTAVPASAAPSFSIAAARRLQPRLALFQLVLVDLLLLDAEFLRGAHRLELRGLRRHHELIRQRLGEPPRALAGVVLDLDLDEIAAHRLDHHRVTQEVD